MFLMVLALAAMPLDPNQVMGGKAFDIFADATDRQCPDKGLRDIKPADLDYLQRTYYDTLPTDQQQQLDSANYASKVCSDQNGLSCVADQTLDAAERTDTLSGFVNFVCTH